MQPQLTVIDPHRRYGRHVVRHARCQARQNVLQACCGIPARRRPRWHGPRLFFRDGAFVNTSSTSSAQECGGSGTSPTAPRPQHPLGGPRSPCLGLLLNGQQQLCSIIWPARCAELRPNDAQAVGAQGRTRGRSRPDYISARLLLRRGGAVQRVADNYSDVDGLAWRRPNYTNKYKLLLYLLIRLASFHFHPCEP